MTTPRLGLALGLSLLTADAIAAIPEVPFEGGFPKTSADRLYPLDEVKRGQRGVGYTVFEENRVEPFDVEVLGILRGMLGPGQDVILARLTGDKIEYTGVISGMSGSPVYIDGRLVGAVAYRFGSFSKEPIAGITPIRSMLETFDAKDEGARAAAPLFDGALPVSRFRSRAMLPPLDIPAPVAAGASAGARPISTPLSISGLAPEAFEGLAGSLRDAGFVPMAGGGAGTADLPTFSPRDSAARRVDDNGGGEAGTVPAAPIAPGAPIGALLMRGDMDIAAIGTVTYVDAERVLAFGHPFIGNGPVAFPMATAAILNTLASEAGSYKQGQAAREVGAIRQDRLTAIGGDLGQAAPMVPVRIVVQGLDEPRASVGEETRVEIVDDPVWFPVMLENAIASAGSRRLGYEAGGTVDLEVRMHVDDLVLEYADRISAPPPLRLPAFAARDVATSAAMILRNELGTAQMKGVEVFLRTGSDVELAEIDRVIPERPVVRPGETLRLEARLRPYRGEPVVVPLSVPIPQDAEGDLEIFVGGGLELDQRDENARGDRTPRSIEDLLAVLADRRPAQGLYARVYQPQPGLTDDMAVMTALPPSQRAALSVRPRAGLEAATSHPGPQVSVPQPYVVAGGIPISVRVKR